MTVVAEKNCLSAQTDSIPGCLFG